MELDFVIPAHKPTPGWEVYALARIESLIALWDGMHPEDRLQIRIFVAPDASPFGHEAAVRRFWAESPHPAVYVDYDSNRGKGAALRAAMALSDAPMVVYTDWDIPYTESSMVALLETLGAGADVVLAERERATYRDALPFGRKVLTQISHLLNGVFLALPRTDTQGGLKGMNERGRAAFMRTQIDRFLFDTEFIAYAVRMGLSVRSVEARIREGVRSSHYSPRTLLRELPGLVRLFHARWLAPRQPRERSSGGQS